MRRLLASLSIGQRIAILLTAAAVGAGLYQFSRWNRESDFRPLYASLAAEDAGAVVQRLKESAVDYRLSEDGRTILVPSARVAELRLSLASAGLPRNGRIGFELFDKTNFGTTEFAEQVNYRRALEGELERSVVSLSAVEQARVHLTFPKESVYLETQQPAKGSVLVKLRPGAHLTPQNVSAIGHLIAGAVEGLVPEAVAILDMQGNLLNRPRRQPAGEEGASGDAILEFRQAMERDLVAKVSTTLEPLVGPDKFRASAALDCDFTSGELSEETFDPTKSVMLSSQKTEESTGAATSSGVPGTASNLPRPTSRPALAAGEVGRTTENITYQSSRVVRRVRLPQGAIKRMSIAVLVDHDVKWTKAGATMQRSVEPPSPEKLKVIRDLVTAAVGLNPDRGDQLIVESLAFDSTVNAEPPGAAPSAPAAPRAPAQTWLDGLKDPKMLMVAGGAVVLLLLVGFVALRLLKKRLPAAPAGGLPELPPGPGERALAAAASHARQLEEEAAAYAELPPPPPKRSDIVAGRLREAVKVDPMASAQVLRGWLTEDEE
jgi:flagellar M-ring protein FliF